MITRETLNDVEKCTTRMHRRIQARLNKMQYSRDPNKDYRQMEAGIDIDRKKIEELDLLVAAEDVESVRDFMRSMF